MGDKSHPKDQREKLSFYLPKGQRKIEIAFESDKVEKAETTPSEGEASLYRLSFQGINRGGAIACMKCPEGQVATAEEPFTCTVCGKGREPNLESKQTHFSLA